MCGPRRVTAPPPTSFVQLNGGPPMMFATRWVRAVQPRLTDSGCRPTGINFTSHWIELWLCIIGRQTGAFTGPLLQAAGKLPEPGAGCGDPVPGAGCGVVVPSNSPQVNGPTMPSMRRPRARWNERTAPSVRGPKIPSTGPGLKPADASRVCRSMTDEPREPMRSVGIPADDSRSSVSNW